MTQGTANILIMCDCGMIFGQTYTLVDSTSQSRTSSLECPRCKRLVAFSIGWSRET